MIKTYSFADGKYQIDRDTDSYQIMDVRRNGEKWHIGYESTRFDNMTHAMLNYIDELQNEKNL